MRLSHVAPVLLLCACATNRGELSAARGLLEAHLSEMKAVIDTMPERARQVDALEAELQAALSELPTSDELMGRKSVPLSERKPGTPPELPFEGASWPPTPRAPTITLSEPSIFEGAEAKRMRGRIADMQRHIEELHAVIVEVEKIEARRVELTAKLQRLRELRRTELSRPQWNDVPRAFALSLSAGCRPYLNLTQPHQARAVSDASVTDPCRQSLWHPSRRAV